MAGILPDFLGSPNGGLFGGAFGGEPNPLGSIMDNRNAFLGYLAGALAGGTLGESIGRGLAGWNEGARSDANRQAQYASVRYLAGSSDIDPAFRALLVRNPALAAQYLTARARRAGLERGAWPSERSTVQAPSAQSLVPPSVPTPTGAAASQPNGWITPGPPIPQLDPARHWGAVAQPPDATELRPMAPKSSPWDSAPLRSGLPTQPPASFLRQPASFTPTSPDSYPAHPAPDRLQYPPAPEPASPWGPLAPVPMPQQVRIFQQPISVESAQDRILGPGVSASRIGSAYTSAVTSGDRKINSDGSITVSARGSIPGVVVSLSTDAGHAMVTTVTEADTITIEPDGSVSLYRA